MKHALIVLAATLSLAACAVREEEAAPPPTPEFEPTLDYRWSGSDLILEDKVNGCVWYVRSKSYPVLIRKTSDVCLTTVVKQTPPPPSKVNVTKKVNVKVD